MRLLIALGGNALLRRGEPADAAVQARHVRAAAAALAPVLAEHTVVLTHGNGPQVGLLALQSEAAREAPPSPLDVLDAESEGWIGYLLERELRNALPGREVATLLTQTVVDATDPAFARPTKPIGPTYPAAEARRLADARGWTVGPDGAGWRRLAPSPEPRRIVELAAIRLLLDAGVLVICTGGGGIPVTLDAAGRLRGAEAVVDKDLAAAVLATSLRLDGLILLTDVDAVYADWQTAAAHPIRRSTATELRRQTFATGSMGPKVAAACRFVEAGGAWCAIGALADAAAVVAGTAGTRISPG